jgi:hypothetical protein
MGPPSGSSQGRTEVLAMGIGPLSKTNPRISPAVDLEALRIGAAMEHIKAHGNLDGFPARRGERLALVTTAGKQGLLVWNRSRGRYELTSRGDRRVRALRRAGRNALRDRQGGAVGSGMNAVVTAAATVLVVGAAFLAFHPVGSTDSAPLREPGAYFTSGAAAPAGAQAAKRVELQADLQPRAVTAETVPDSKQVSSEQVSAVPPSGRADAAGPNARTQGGETARSPVAAVSNEPEITIGAVVPAEKSVANDRDRPEASNLAHKHKRSGRRGRDGNDEPKTVGPGYASGYAYAPYGSTPTYRHWSAPPWWFR